MKVLTIDNQIPKLVKAGLGKLGMLLLFLSLIVAMGSCGGKDSDLDIKPDPDEKKDDDSDDKKDDVIILSPSDIIDYDKFYKPDEFKGMDLLRSDSKWSFVRSKQSDHFIVFWEAGFGADPNASTVSADMRVNIDDLLVKAENFFNLNVNTLKFADYETSNVKKYKMQIYLLYQTEWAAYGGGVDNVIGGLWVNPATCQPVGSTIAHEIGHSFQYQIYADMLANGATSDDFSRGFRHGFGGNGGNAFWEQTAQWQSFQSYPEEAFISYNFGVYTDNYHRHVCHEWQRYASYFIHYYWAQKHGIDMVARVWRAAVAPEDPFQTYMRINSMSVDQLNEELYEAASRFATWDLDNIRSIGSNFIGKHTYKFYQLADGSYQVAYSKCPGTTGYNIVPLNVPAAGTTISIKFDGMQPGAALAADDPGTYVDEDKSFTTRKYNSGSITRAGWRYGYVALLNDGRRVYGEMNKKMASTVDFTVPENCAKLWFVVAAAPSTYVEHPWDEKESNDDQWPYKIKITNSDLLGSMTIDPTKDPEDVTLTYNVSFKASADEYTGTSVNLTDNGDVAKLAQAFVMQPSAIANQMLSAKSSPAEGKIAFAAIEANGNANYATTANGYGFWFDSAGDVTAWGASNDSKVFVEFDASSMEFSIGQYPGKSSAGDKYTVKEALIYTKDGKQYKASFVFNITIN